VDRGFGLEEIHWRLTLGPSQARSLYATFSPIARLPESAREALLDQLASIAENQFGGVVERRLVTPLYLSQRVG